MKSNFKRFAIPGLALAIVLADTAIADFSCKTTVSYTWRREGEETDQTVAWKILQRVGKTEDLGKKLIAQAMVRDSQIARAQCEQEHQNLASCLATKYEVMSDALARAGFTARKSIEEAITADCQRKQGTCKEVKNSEVECTLIEEAAAAGASGATGASGKKDEKEKKKK
jgi:hypothetical protein